MIGVCANCLYFDKIEGECRKRAPTRGADGKSKWPVIIHREVTWCGDYKYETTVIKEDRVFT